MPFVQTTLANGVLESARARTRDRGGFVRTVSDDEELILWALSKQTLALISRSNFLPGPYKKSFTADTDLADGDCVLPHPLFSGTLRKDVFRTKWLGSPIVVIDLEFARYIARFLSYMREPFDQNLYFLDLWELFATQLFINRCFDASAHFIEFGIHLARTRATDTINHRAKPRLPNRLRATEAMRTAVFCLLGHEFGHPIVETKSTMQEVLLDLGQLSFDATVENAKDHVAEYPYYTEEALVHDRENIIREAACDYFSVLFCVCGGFYWNSHRQYSVMGALLALQMSREVADLLARMQFSIDNGFDDVRNRLSEIADWQYVARRAAGWFFYAMERTAFFDDEVFRQTGYSDDQFRFEVGSFLQDQEKIDAVRMKYFGIVSTEFGKIASSHVSKLLQMPQSRRAALSAIASSMTPEQWTEYVDRPRKEYLRVAGFEVAKEEPLPRLDVLH